MTRASCARPQRRVVERHALGQHHVEDHAADRRVDDLAVAGLSSPSRRASSGYFGRRTLIFACVCTLPRRVGHLHFFQRREDHVVALGLGHAHRQVVATHHHVLRRADDRRAVGRAEDVVRAHHQRVGFDLGLDRQRQVDGHLVAVEVGVEALAHQRMELDGVAFHEHRLERLDAHAVQRRSAIEQHRVIADHLFEDIPHLIVLALEHLLGALDRVGVAELLEPADDERLVQLQRDLLRQAALVQLEARTDDDHAAGRVIDALAEQVLAEPALLALDHVGERLERAVRRAEHRPLAAVVVEQRVDRLLQHPLFVADDDFRRVEVDQLLEPVVAVDDAAIEVVEIARGEVAAVEQHERTQIGRNHRDHVQHHPLRLVVRVADRFDVFSRLMRSLAFCFEPVSLSSSRRHLRELHQVELLQQLADRLGAHRRLRTRSRRTARGPGDILLRSAAAAA